MKRFAALLMLVLAVVSIIFLVSCSHLPGSSNDGQRRLATFRFPRASNESAYISHQDNINIHDAFQEAVSDFFEIEDDDLAILARQWELLQQFMEEESAVRTARRGLVMNRVVTYTAPPSFYELYGLDWDCGAFLALDLTFTVGTGCEGNLRGERLMSILQELAEICGDSMRTDMIGYFASGMSPTRHSLPPSQLVFLEALEAYMNMVNAPFWADNAIDPIITHIGLPNPRSSGRCYFFTVWLYDLAFITLCYDELAIYTMPLRQEMIDFIGMDYYRFEFRVNRCDMKIKTNISSPPAGESLLTD